MLIGIHKKFIKIDQKTHTGKMSLILEKRMYKPTSKVICVSPLPHEVTYKFSYTLDRVIIRGIPSDSCCEIHSNCYSILVKTLLLF